jgi:hypothetical protein
MSNTPEHDLDREMSGIDESDVDSEYDRSVSAWEPDFRVRPRSDTAKSSSSALVPFKEPPARFSKEHVETLEDLVAAKDVNFDLMFDFCAGLLTGKIPKDSQAFNLAHDHFAFFRAPHPDTVMAWNNKIHEAQSRVQVAEWAKIVCELEEQKKALDQQTAAGKAEVTAIEHQKAVVKAEVKALEIKVKDLHVQIGNLSLHVENNTSNTTNNYYNGKLKYLRHPLMLAD